MFVNIFTSLWLHAHLEGAKVIKRTNPTKVLQEHSSVDNAKYANLSINTTTKNGRLTKEELPLEIMPGMMHTRFHKIQQWLIYHQLDSGLLKIPV